jgi:carbamoyl-phosphate synthase large subunit
MAKSFNLENYNDIEKAFKVLPKSDKYWVRMKIGAGSKGATWVRTPDQAKNWIELWESLRGFPPDAFTLNEFLPGKDYAFQSVWKDGKPVVMKMVQRLVYFYGVQRLSGMSSTPQIAKTVYDPDALKTILKAIDAVTKKPHGNFCVDMKGDRNGTMCITEFNIGRFCMITPIFDLTGKINTAEAYVKCALDHPIENNYELDYEKDKYLIRQLDTLPTVCSKKDIEKYKSKFTK